MDSLGWMPVRTCERPGLMVHLLGDWHEEALHMTTEAVIVDAMRSPIGRHNGALSGVRPDDLLRPAFRQGGTVTAGNASGINDGAIALLIM
jgi:hypothetical protein